MRHSPMIDHPATQSLTSRVLKTELVNWREFNFIQQEDFKDLSATAKAKLTASIVSNDFTQPFYVWLDPKTDLLYCLDGKHRTMILEELAGDGFKVPDMLPATFIRCENQKEAAKLVLLYSSSYAKVSVEGFTSFLEQYDLDPEELQLSINIPDIKEAFESESIGDFTDEGISIKNQYGVIVICENETDQEAKFKLLQEQGFNCKVVVT
jgi:hypothetical protein